MEIAPGMPVAYQGRCWIVSRVVGAWLHLMVPGNHHYRGIDIPRSEVSKSLKINNSKFYLDCKA